MSQDSSKQRTILFTFDSIAGSCFVYFYCNGIQRTIGLLESANSNRLGTQMRPALRIYCVVLTRYSDNKQCQKSTVGTRSPPSREIGKTGLNSALWVVWSLDVRQAQSVYSYKTHLKNDDPPLLQAKTFFPFYLGLSTAVGCETTYSEANICRREILQGIFWPVRDIIGPTGVFSVANGVPRLPNEHYADVLSSIVSQKTRHLLSKADPEIWSGGQDPKDGSWQKLAIRNYPSCCRFTEIQPEATPKVWMPEGLPPAVCHRNLQCPAVSHSILLSVFPQIYQVGLTR